MSRVQHEPLNGIHVSKVAKPCSGLQKFRSPTVKYDWQKCRKSISSHKWGQMAYGQLCL